MTLREKQVIFWQHVAALILEAKRVGTPIFILEWMRSQAQQEINIAKGVSKTKNSKHLIGLAVDFAFIADLREDGKLNYSAEKYRYLGEYWESLDPLNGWGGRFGDDPSTTKIEGWDPGHFEYRG